MAAPDRLTENSRLQGEQRRVSNARNLEPRGPGQVGCMSSSIEAPLGSLA